MLVPPKVHMELEGESTRSLCESWKFTDLFEDNSFALSSSSSSSSTSDNRLSVSETIPSSSSVSSDQGSSTGNDEPTTPIKSCEHATSQQRRSPLRRLVQFIHGLSPQRSRLVRQSRSYGEFRSYRSTGKRSNPRDLSSAPCIGQSVAKRSVGCSTNRSLNNNESDQITKRHPIHCPHATTHSCSNLSLDSWSASARPGQEVVHLRQSMPTAFVDLVISYLGFLRFTSAELTQVKQAVKRQADLSTALTWLTSTSGNFTSPQAAKTKGPYQQLPFKVQTTNGLTNKTFNPFQKRTTRASTTNDKVPFIIRRPGNQASLNELDQLLFPSRSRTQSRNRSGQLPSSSDFATVTSIHTLLAQYDANTIACLLNRTLRRHGSGLIPDFLRPVFYQLVDLLPSQSIQSPLSVRRREARLARGVSLLSQLLCPSLLLQVITPLFSLLTRIANEPSCQVDASSLAVLYSPIFFTDPPQSATCRRSTKQVVQLVNPIGRQLLAGMIELGSKQEASYERLFWPPLSFIHDCKTNTERQLQSPNSALYSSVRYCSPQTTTTSSLSSHQQRSRSIERDLNLASTILFGSNSSSCSSSLPSLNANGGSVKVKKNEKTILPATFVTKRPRESAPKEPTTPVLKTLITVKGIEIRVMVNSNHDLHLFHEEENERIVTSILSFPRASFSYFNKKQNLTSSTTSQALHGPILNFRVRRTPVRKQTTNNALRVPLLSK